MLSARATSVDPEGPEDDLRALFRYLQTLPAAPGGPDPVKREVIAVSAR